MDAQLFGKNNTLSLFRSRSTAIWRNARGYLPTRLFAIAAPFNCERATAKCLKIGVQSKSIWAHLKQHELANFCPRDLWNLSAGARSALRSMQRRRIIVTACWQQASLF